MNFLVHLVAVGYFLMSYVAVTEVTDVGFVLAYAGATVGAGILSTVIGLPGIDGDDL